MIELHIWGPAFGLPSIDAECIAAVVLLRRLLSTHEWVLVAAHDASWSPTGDFPAIIHDDRRIAGFAAIASHLTQLGHSLDTGLTSIQSVDSLAIRTHLVASARPLLAAHLYTLPTNYHSTTRPAFTQILPIHSNYTIVPRRHAVAQHLALPLGLSAPAEDLPTDPRADPITGSNASLSSSSPSLLFRRTQSLRNALQQQAATTRFRVQGSVDTFAKPLLAVLQDKPYLFGTEPCTADCLLFGYLSLLIDPDMPQPWIEDALRTPPYTSLLDWLARFRIEMLRDEEDINPQVVMQAPHLQNDKSPTIEDSAQRLPWRVAPPSTALAITSSLFSSLSSATLISSRTTLHLTRMYPLLRNPFVNALLASSIIPTIASVGLFLYGLATGRATLPFLSRPATGIVDRKVFFAPANAPPGIGTDASNEAFNVLTGRL